jgi:hypothetical protein
MLEAATPDFLPVIALGLFAGLRPESEIWRLAWSNIGFEDRGDLPSDAGDKGGRGNGAGRTGNSGGQPSRLAKRLSASYIRELPLCSVQKRRQFSRVARAWRRFDDILQTLPRPDPRTGEAREFWEIYPQSPQPFSVDAA